MFRAYATEFQDVAREAAVTDTDSTDASGPIIQGHFTRALLAALRGVVASPPGGVTPSALEKYLIDAVPRIAQASNHIQTARVPANELPDDDLESRFGNAQPLVAGNITIRFSPNRRDDVVLFGPNLEEVKRGGVASGPWVLPLERGLYQLVDGQGEEMTIRFQPKEEMADVEF